MEEFKIKKIKNLSDLKNVYSFISYTFFSDSMKNGEDLIPFHELYELMLENLVKRKELQFFGALGKNIVSAVVASVLPYDKKCLSVEIFFVRELCRGNGFAHIMLSEIEMIARRYGFERIRFVFKDLSYEFFQNKGYRLFLELAIPETLSVEEIVSVHDLLHEHYSLIKYNDINFVEYQVHNADWKLKHKIAKNAPLVKAHFVLEKRFSKSIS